jgi:hypothetical protein
MSRSTTVTVGASPRCRTRRGWMQTSTSTSTHADASACMQRPMTV